MFCSELHQNAYKCALFDELATNAPELVGFVIVTPVAWWFHQWWFINKDGFGINALLDLWNLSLSPKIVLERLLEPFDVGCSVFVADGPRSPVTLIPVLCNLPFVVIDPKARFDLNLALIGLPWLHWRLSWISAHATPPKR